MSDSHTTICGNLTADPKLTVTSKGGSRTLLLVAVDRHWFHNDEWHKSRDFLRVAVYGKMAEHCVDSLQLGDRVIATGRISHRRVEGSDGTDQHFYEVVADEVGFSLKHQDLNFDNQE